MNFTKEDIVRHITELRNGNELDEKSLSKIFEALSSSTDALELLMSSQLDRSPSAAPILAKTFFALGFLVATRCSEELPKEYIN